MSNCNENNGCQKIARLENWYLVEVEESFPLPSLGRQIGEYCPLNKVEKSMLYFLGGNVYNHPRHIEGQQKFKDGHNVVTSCLSKVVPDKELVITHSGTRYKLGEPRAEYEKMFPNAKQRLFDKFV